MQLISMSTKDIDRYDVLRRLIAGDIKQGKAMGYGHEFSLIPIAGSFYFSRPLTDTSSKDSYAS